MILFVTAIILYLAPIPSGGQFNRVVKAKTGPGQIAVVGPSTIDYVSNCDQDRRTIPAMITALSGTPVLNLAVGGQPIVDSLNLAALSAGNSNVKDILFFLAHTQVDDWTTPDYRTLLFYKALNPGFKVYDAETTTDFWNGLSGEPRRLVHGYEFQGVHYPDYNVLSAREFAKEKKLSSCPEVLTHDKEFTKSYFWWTNVEKKENSGLYNLLADLDRVANANGKKLHVVVLPTNLELIDSLNPDWRTSVSRFQDSVVENLQRRGLDVVDLSDDFKQDDFAVQWCACIHMSEKGRLKISKAVVPRLSSYKVSLSDFSASHTIEAN
jgi:hypothetical protein